LAGPAPSPDAAPVAQLASPGRSEHQHPVLAIADERIDLLARAKLARVNAQVCQRLAQKAVKAGVAFVKAPPHHTRKLRRVNVVGQPVPAERALAKAAQRAHHQQRMLRKVLRERRILEDAAVLELPGALVHAAGRFGAVAWA
jgi:hypothetical protein